MKNKQTWRWVPAALLLACGGTFGQPDDLRVTSLDTGGNLVFRTADTSGENHHYRVERATSLVPAEWSAERTVSGVGAGTFVSNVVKMDTATAFYRVVATSNSNAFVDGDYMSVDISSGTATASYPVSYHASSGVVPGGVTADLYKTTRILFRRIPKCTFAMGSPSDELGHIGDETQHQVTLTEDFYLGVFEVTQRQWELVMGNKPSYFTNATYYQTRPVEQVSYHDVRENPDNSPINPNWPVTNTVHPDSFMGKLRAKTGLAGFDLPTETQWEYACRAGTTTALNSGYNLTSTGSDPRMSEVGRYWHNTNGSFNPDSVPSAGTALTGSYLPNAWGLYDMHGNVGEWCLDWYGIYPGTVTDPKGNDPGSYIDRIYRGGGFGQNAHSCRSACRSLIGPTARSLAVGFRVCCGPPRQP